MADYKIVDAEQLDAALDSLAESIRTKSGVKGDLAFPNPNEFKTAVDNIKVEFKTQAKTVTPSQAIQTVKPDSGIDGLSSVTVNAIPSNYIDKTKISHFATGVINNVTEGQQIRITGITDAVTGETFNLKGVVGILCPTATTNYTTTAGKGAVVAFYKTADNADGVGIAAYTPERTVRANTGMKNNDILGISGNGFSFLSPATMYGLMPAARWRWFAWG